VENVAARVEWVAGPARAADVGSRRVDERAVRGHAPLHAAVRAAFADARLPENLALFRSVERIDDARLLAREQSRASLQQNRGGAEVVIGPFVERAVRAMLAVARAVVGVAGRDLLVPYDTAVAERERDDGIARLARGLRVVVAGRHVQQTARRVDGRRRPDGY